MRSILLNAPVATGDSVAHVPAAGFSSGRVACAIASLYALTLRLLRLPWRTVRSEEQADVVEGPSAICNYTCPIDFESSWQRRPEHAPVPNVQPYTRRSANLVQHRHSCARAALGKEHHARKDHLLHGQLHLSHYEVQFKFK